MNANELEIKYVTFTNQRLHKDICDVFSNIRSQSFESFSVRSVTTASAVWSYVSAAVTVVHSRPCLDPAGSHTKESFKQAFLALLLSRLSSVVAFLSDTETPSWPGGVFAIK